MARNARNARNATTTTTTTTTTPATPTTPTTPAAVLAPSALALALAAPRQQASGGAYQPPARQVYAPGRPVGGLVAAHTYTVAPQWQAACPARPGTYRSQFWPMVQAGSGGLCSVVTAQVPIVTWAYWLQAAAAGHVALHCASTGRRVVPGPGGKGYTYAD